MKKRIAQEDTAPRGEHRTIDVGSTAQFQTGPDHGMDDAGRSATAVQRQQQRASAVPGATELQQRAQMMAASPCATTLRARQSQMSAPVQRKDRPGQTGLPAQLKSGIEALSGINMDHVQVHYNSDKPAQLQAHAYAQGRDIHVAPGQEQHLPHEAWHVVQQAQGRVRPTVQTKAGLPVNDDAGLEGEADVMGARAVAQGAVVGSAPGHQDEAASSSRAQTGSQGSSGTVQMAGHAEDLCMVGNWVVKRADHTEIMQYVNGEVPKTAPGFDGPHYTAEPVLSFLQNAGVVVAADKLAKINLMAQPMIPDGKGFMILESATTGMAGPEMRDLKMGKHTASGTDQERHGVTGLAKLLKIVQHETMDWLSESSTYGYRDEDRWKVSKTGDNTDELQNMLNRASPGALAMIANDLTTFGTWLGTTKVVYVGMSLLVVAGGGQGKAAAIDFEHPIRDTDESFLTHRAGLLTGLDNLSALVRAFLHRGSFKRSEEGNAGIGNDDL